MPHPRATPAPGASLPWRYRTFPATPPLDAYLECLWVLEQPASAPATEETIIAYGQAEWIVHCGERFLGEREGVRVLHPDTFLVGHYRAPMRVHAVGAVCTLGVRFRIGADHFFHGLPASQLAQQVVPADELWGRPLATLRERLEEHESLATRLALLEEFLLQRLDTPRAHNLAPLRLAVAELRRRHGMLAVRELARHCGWTVRHLERVFLRVVGVGPKTLCRVLRFRHALARVAIGGEPWLRAALECGYFDQAHLVRDVRQFAGESPRQLQRRGWGLSRFLMGAARPA